MAHYENITFPDYEYREFPKAVTVGKDAKGRPVQIIVNDEDEEAEVTKSKAAPVREDETRARYELLAGVNGVQIDKAWSLGKIKAALVAASVDPEADPTK